MPDRPAYPPTRTSDVVDIYHGARVADPYRWLEDAGSVETVAWVEAQNALTRSMLDGPVRQSLAERLAVLYDYPRTSAPLRRGRRYFFTHNPGLDDQPSLYVQDGADGTARMLLDPNALATGHPVAITALAPNESSTLIAYGLSASGSDRQEVLIRDTATGLDLPDRIQWVKFVSIAWVKDDSGFYYTRFPEPGSVPEGDEQYFNQVYFHRLGDSQSRDTRIFHALESRETVFGVEVTHDDRWVVITAFQGSSDKSEIHLIDRTRPSSLPLALFTGFRSAWRFVSDMGARLFFQTDDGAPRGRIVVFEPDLPDHSAIEVVPESGDRLSAAAIVSGTLVVSYLHNASDVLRLFDPSGAPRGEIPLPIIGSITEMTGRPDDDEVFLSFSSFTYPPAILRHDFSTGVTGPWAVRVTSPVRLKPDTTDPLEGADPLPGSVRLQPNLADPPAGGVRLQPDFARYLVSQAWYLSKDGTQVSMFLVHRRELNRDRERPVLLSGYGGFNISLTPSFEPSIFPLLDRGGIYALANLRGGGEYGEAWHEAGMFERKQNVFDDFIAAAEWLIASGYTKPEKIGIEGGSNGGLLTAAVMLQRPDLFSAVVCRVPVVDMLRYHLFTVGRFWISEYGSADDPGQFGYLLKYSPYHNVQDGAAYPPVLIMTADTDDRVSPGMAKKFAARLQAAGGRSPALIRVEREAGHGAGKPVSKQIAEDADIHAFLFDYLKI